MIYDSKYSLVYDRTYALLRDQLTESTLIAELANSSLSPGENILDIGCGTGIHLAILSKNLKGRFGLVGIDGSEFMIASARQRLGANTPLLHAKLDSTWPIKSSTIGLAFGTFNLIQVFTDKTSRSLFLLEIYRILRQGGIAVLDCHCEPNFGTQYPSGVISEFYKAGVIIRVSSIWSPGGNVKKTFISFLSSSTGVSIHEGQHDMLRISWSELVADCSNAGFSIKERYADWNRTLFNPNLSPVVVLILEKR